jgi:hypothetical protein
MRCIAVTTTHSAAELRADAVVTSLEALSVRREPDGLTVDIRPGFRPPTPGDSLSIVAGAV